MGKETKESRVRVAIVGESGVGKTCFTDMFLEGKPFIQYSAVIPDTRRRSVLVDNEQWSLSLMDLSSTTLRDPDPAFRPDFFKNSFAHSDGIVLLYDISSKESFEKVTNEAYFYIWSCREPENIAGEKYVAGRQRVGCVLVGNKADIVRADPDKRQVRRELAEQWAHSLGFNHFEVTTHDRVEIEEAVEGLVKSIKMAKKRDADEIEEDREEEEKEKEKKELKKGEGQQSKVSIRDRIKSALKSSNPSS